MLIIEIFSLRKFLVTCYRIEKYLSPELSFRGSIIEQSGLFLSIDVVQLYFFHYEVLLLKNLRSFKTVKRSVNFRNKNVFFSAKS